MFTCCGLTTFCDCICRGQDFLLDNVNAEGNRCHRGVLYDVVYLWGRGLHHLQRLMLIAQVLLPGQLRGGVPDMPHPLPPQPHWVGVIARVGGRAQATAEELQKQLSYIKQLPFIMHVCSYQHKQYEHKDCLCFCCMLSGHFDTTEPDQRVVCYVKATIR